MIFLTSFILGFSKLNLRRIDLIELIWITLGIVKINSGMTYKLLMI